MSIFPEQACRLAPIQSEMDSLRVQLPELV
jgi:hypothetical protein